MLKLKLPNNSRVLLSANCANCFITYTDDEKHLTTSSIDSKEFREVLLSENPWLNGLYSAEMSTAINSIVVKKYQRLSKHHNIDAKLRVPYSTTKIKIKKGA